MVARDCIALTYHVARVGWRLKLKLVTQLKLPDGSKCWARLSNISSTGFLVHSARSVRVGEHLKIVLPGAGPVSAEVRWADGDCLGCRFARRLGPASIAIEIFAIAKRWALLHL